MCKCYFHESVKKRKKKKERKKEKDTQNEPIVDFYDVSLVFQCYRADLYSRNFYILDTPCRMSKLQLVTLGLLVAVVVSDKRQGVFGPCQGWGAGCTSYFSYRPQPQPPTRKITRNVHKAPAYMFTSGEYNQIYPYVYQYEYCFQAATYGF